MKVVQLITTLGYGGAEKICIDLCNVLVKQPEVEKVYLISLFNHDPQHRNLNTIDKEVEVIFLGKRKGLDLIIFFKLNKILNKIEPDIIHTHLTGLSFMLSYILSTKRLPKIIHTVHNVAEKDVHYIFQTVHKLFFKRKWVTPIAISPEIQQSIAAYYKIPLPAVIENFTPEPALSENDMKVKGEIESYKTDENTKVLINVGRINPQKNQVLLIEAFKSLKQENIILLIVGGPDSRFEKLNGILKNLSQGTNNVYLLGNKFNVVDYIAHSDAIIFSSLYEGLPVALLEAIALGIIPISTSVGGIPSIISDGKTGILSSEPSLPDLTNAIKRYLLLTSEQKMEMSRKLRTLYKVKYSVERAVNSYFNTYKSL